MVGKSRKSIVKKPSVNTVKTKESVRYNPIAKEEEVKERAKEEKVKELKTYYKNPLSDLIPEYDIYVFNLAPAAVENDLWRLFGPFGALKNVAIVRDVETKEHKGFGFVTMKNKDEANQAIEMLNGHSLHGRPLKISFKNEKR